MRKVIRKMFWMWSLDKEEQWLNEMAEKGLCLVSAGFFRYEFQECYPGEYIIRNDYLEHDSDHPKSVEYIRFFEETGAEHIATRGAFVYFRKRRSLDGSFELYSDKTSRIKYYNRVLKQIGFSAAVELFFGIKNILQCIFITDGMGVTHILNFTLGAVATVLGICFVSGYIKFCKKRKALKEQQKLFE